MNVLIVSARVLYPADTGAKIRSSSIFERLASRHHVTIACLRTPDDTEAQIRAMDRCCERLVTVPWTEARKRTPRFYAELAANLLSPHAYAVSKYRSRALEVALADVVGRRPFDVLVCDFLQPHLNVIRLPFAPKVLFQHNVEARLRRRHADATANCVSRAYLRHEWRRLRRDERRALQTFDHCIAVSEADRRAFADDYGATRTSVVPTGVDVEYFQRRPEPPGVTDLVFTGSMDWFANEDAVLFFVRDVLPRIARERAVVFWIVGRNPGPRVRALADSRPDVRVTGTVDDVRPFVERAALYVVPIRIGGGTRIKIYEAMAMGRAVVSTTVGAEGLPLVAGEHYEVADGAEQLAEAVLALLRHPERRRRLADSAAGLVAAHASWDAVAVRFGEVLEEVARHTRPS